MIHGGHPQTLPGRLWGGKPQLLAVSAEALPCLFRPVVTNGKNKKLTRSRKLVIKPTV